MTRLELANKLGLTDKEVQRYQLSYLQNEGYDSAGNEYDTLVDYIRAMRIISIHPDNRGAGGHDDNRDE